MPRAPFQVLVFPYRLGSDGGLEYAIFRRADLGVWQGIAGGGDAGETPAAAAIRESWEEAGLPPHSRLLELESVGRIPALHFAAAAEWGPEVVEIPEYAFGMEVRVGTIELFAEHTAVAWCSFSDALALLEWESNRIALQELHERLSRLDIVKA